MTAPVETRQLRVCECGEWTYAEACGPCRLPEPPPWPEHTILIRLACAPTSEKRPGYAWRGGRLVRVPIRAGGVS